MAATIGLMGQPSVTPQGGEYSILGSLPGDQVLPSISLNANGGALVWQDNMINGRNRGWGHGGALLNSTASMSGRSFRVNRILAGVHLAPQAQLLDNNRTLYVWQSSVAGTPDIYARLAGPAKDGTGYGTNFYTADLRVNAYLRDAQTKPAVAALPDGNAVVTWQSYGQDGSMNGIYARHILTSGPRRFATPREVLVNQSTSYNQRDPAIATLANGNYVIVWVSEMQRSSASVDVYARMFSLSGAPLGDGYEILINDSQEVCSSPAVAALNDGGFTVVWNQKDSMTPTNANDIWGRAFSASGAAEGSSFRINTYLYGDQYGPRIATGPSGSLVVWTSLGQDGSREGVFGRFLAGGLQVSGNEFQVNTTTASQQIHPTVAWNGVDRFVVVWASFSGSAGFDLYGQAYALSNSQ